MNSMNFEEAGEFIVNCVSISYKKADIDKRRQLSLSTEKTKELIRFIITQGIAHECVVLSTCNRTEVYYSDNQNDRIIAALAESVGLTQSFLLKYVMTFFGDKATEHLFRVAGGLDSMVIGEDEILGQTKAAYFISKEENAVGYEMNVAFQAAIACAKRIKTETIMSKTSVSVATLAANEAAKISDNVSVLVIGASGTIGMSTLKNLLSHKNVAVTATLRHSKAKCKEFENLGAAVIDYDERYKYIAASDCIISATSSPHYTVTGYDLRQYVKDDRRRLFIDLAVPPDIDSSISSFNGVTLINIDHFETLAKQNNNLKLECIDEAEHIISQELDTLRKDIKFHDFLPYFDDIVKNTNTLSIDKLIYKMKTQASASAFSEFLNVLQNT